MKILAIASKSDMSGGANRSLLMIVLGLRDQCGVECEVLLPEAAGALNDELTKHAIPWHTAPYMQAYIGVHRDGRDALRLVRSLINSVLTPIAVRKLARTMGGADYDLVYVNTSGPNIGARLADLWRLPLVCHVREALHHRSGWPGWTRRTIYQSAQALIFVSDAARSAFGVRDSEHKMTTVPNGVELRGQAPRIRRSADGINLLLAGRLTKEKGHEDAIRALRMLHDAGHTEVRLHIAGRTPPKSYSASYERGLRRLVADLELHESVSFLGQVPDMEDLRSSMDCELICSKFEAFGRVTVEAMRCGLVVIGANSGGTAEIITDGETGLVYEQGDPRDLARRVLWVIENRERAETIARRGAEDASTKYTAESAVRGVHEVLKGVLTTP